MEATNQIRAQKKFKKIYFTLPLQQRTTTNTSVTHTHHMRNKEKLELLAHKKGKKKYIEIPEEDTLQADGRLKPCFGIYPQLIFS